MELGDNNQEFLNVLASIELAVWSWNIPEKKMFWSKELFRLYGLKETSDPISFDEHLKLIRPQDREEFQIRVEKALREATESKTSSQHSIEYGIVLPDGSERWIEGRGIVLVDGAGSPIRISGTAFDISQRKQTAEKLRKSEELHRIFSQFASDYVYSVDLKNPTLFPEIVGGSFERTTGMTPAEVEAKGGWWAVIHPDDHAALLAIYPTIQAGKPSLNEYRIINGIGEIRWLRDAVHPIVDNSTGKVIRLVGGVQDITEKKRLEEQLLQAQKLEAVARLSGGIAHDFNNLLSVIMGSVSMLQMELESESARESCQAILDASIRGADLTRAMLVFSRRDAGMPTLINLVDVVRGSMPMLARAVGPRITWKFESDPVPVFVRIDAGQAQLLLLNLTVNARDAMPEGGCIQLSVGMAKKEQGDELPRELSAGPHALLTFSDQGTGIPPDILARIFEPFFTTKALGKGTGLGLAACQGVVEQANGAMQVKSQVGKGTTFHIFLPLISDGAEEKKFSKAHHSPGGTERILVVEDEKPLQEILVKSLRNRGYTVYTADSAEDALKIIKQDPIDLLITDLVLPRARGTELAQQAKAIQPALPILCISGYTGDIELPKDLPLLAKPFTMERLAYGVRALLDGTFDSIELISWEK